MFGFLAAAVVLFIVFGSFLAMLLPLITAGLSLGTGVAVIGLLSHVFTMASFSSELALLIGLGVGIDYALFIVTRYRQALAAGAVSGAGDRRVARYVGPRGAVRGRDRVHRDAGHVRARVSFLYGVAVAAAIAVAFTVLAALTLLPALLGVVGKRVPRRRERRALRESKYRVTDESPPLGAVGGRDPEAPGRVRRRRDADHGRARDPVLLDAARLGRRGQRSRELDHPQGIRPARQGLRPGLQRPAAAGRGGQLRSAEGGVRGRRAEGRATRPASSARPNPRSCRASTVTRRSRSPTSTRRARRRPPRPPTCCRRCVIRSSRLRRRAPACMCSSVGRRRSSTTSARSCRTSCRCSSGSSCCSASCCWCSSSAAC